MNKRITIALVVMVFVMVGTFKYTEYKKNEAIINFLEKNNVR